MHQGLSDLKGVSINECDFCKCKYEKGIILVKVEKVLVDKETGECKRSGALLCGKCFSKVNDSPTGISIVEGDDLVPDGR